MLEELKKQVYDCNMLLPKYGLVTFTWGNVSAIDRKSGCVVIKPSGVDYDSLSPDKMVVVDLDGNIIEGKYNPSSDTPTHIELYKSFPKIAGVVHTHSIFATSFAQATESIPAFGTTHADYFYGSIPCTRTLTNDEIKNEYELNTGKVIAETFSNIDENAIPGVLVANHGPFCWGRDANEAVYHAKVIEEIAKMAICTKLINKKANQIDKSILDKHYLRKHGDNAYYGQK